MKTARKNMPLIGISTEIDVPERIAIKRRYVDAVIQAGGIPYLLPFTDNRQVLQSAVSLLDGLILSGGDDVSPSLYGEIPLPECGNVCPERDSFDYALLELAYERGIPVLGICRGMQVINTYFGGTLYQDIDSQYCSEVCHRSKGLAAVFPHLVHCLQDGELYSIFGEEEVMVHSIHHQAIKKIADDFKVTAIADDGVVEAIESVSGRPIWGVQFHPEIQTADNAVTMRRVFRTLINQANEYVNLIR